MFRAVILIALLVTCGSAGATNFPKPASLDPAVQFWIKVYTRITTNQGYVHDAVNMSVVYETIELPEYASNSERGNLATNAKFRLVKALNELGRGKRSDLTPAEALALTAWPKGTSSSTFRSAAQNVRFQLGQANRFEEGLARSGQWKPHIRNVLQAHNLPPELVVLPHVESSFNPSAYSKVAAAGMWQFMPLTARDFMRVDNVMDERLDPFIATDAAARLLKRNYGITGTWPLALTGYNHGTGGMVRASKHLGTTDIGVIVREYNGTAFGFASRNFYASFLAALEVDSNSERYFGKVAIDSPTRYDVVVLEEYLPASTLAQTTGVSLEELKRHNPALLEPIWSGEKYIPRGYELRVPKAELSQPLDNLIASISGGQRFNHQKPDKLHRVNSGDSLSVIAQRYGTSVNKLMALNGMRNHNIRAGQSLVLPGNVQPDASIASRAAARQTTSHKREYVIQRGDSLWSISRRFKISQQQLIAWNDISDKNLLKPGQKLKIAG